jgi:[acyl-carrier-protein] S-malonyltransferase
MAPAAEVMAQALATVHMQPPAVPLIANVTASDANDAAEIRRLLVEQVTGMVRWRESILLMKEKGVEGLVEIGVGKVLSGLARRIDRDLSTTNVGTPEDVAAFLETM